jgi:hypothetical protein
LARSKDGFAFISANAIDGTASAPEIRARQKQVLGQIGKPASTLNYVIKSINHLSFQISEEVVKASNGRLMDMILLDAVKNGRLYDFSGGVLQKQANTDKLSSVVLAALFTIKVK